MPEIISGISWYAPFELSTNLSDCAETKIVLPPEVDVNGAVGTVYVEPK